MQSKRLAALGAAAVTTALLASPMAGAAQGSTGAPAPEPDAPSLSAAEQVALEAGLSVAPKAELGTKPAGPSPFLAELPDESDADYAGWANYLRQQAHDRAAAPGKGSRVHESETTYGHNETPARAQKVPGFGTGPGQDAAIRVSGSLDGEKVTTVTRPATAEDDGSITLAGTTGTGARSVKTSATIGDGPHGSTGDATGDFDFYAVDVEAGQTLTVDVAVPSGSPLDPVAAAYTPAGAIVATNDDAGDSLDSHLVVGPATTDSTYYVLVASSGTIPVDPFDPGSGAGVKTEGDYDVTLTAAVEDTDFYAVKLRPGDVLGAAVTGSPGYVTIYDTTPKEVQGSSQDSSHYYPAASPLPGSEVSTEHVATRAGWHYVGVTHGRGDYEIAVQAYRPALEGGKRTQKLYLDFDGAQIDTTIFSADFDGGSVKTLSPLSQFIENWGIPADQEDALIDAITARATESLQHDLAESGLNDDFDLEILTSKDSPDVWGEKNVSRIVVGGTMAETEIPTIGIAQSIDPGNFATEETAMVLQDRLSAPAGPAASINTYLTPQSDRIAFVGQAIGNIVAHEAGHFFGNRHTDNSDAHPNIEDAGGAHYDTKFGIGPDGIGGTADDTDLNFGEDAFSPAEGFVGTENTLGRVVFGLTR